MSGPYYCAGPQILWAENVVITHICFPTPPVCLCPPTALGPGLGPPMQPRLVELDRLRGTCRALVLTNQLIRNARPWAPSLPCTYLPGSPKYSVAKQEKRYPCMETGIELSPVGVLHLPPQGLQFYGDKKRAPLTSKINHPAGPTILKAPGPGRG